MTGSLIAGEDRWDFLKDNSLFGFFSRDDADKDKKKKQSAQSDEKKKQDDKEPTGGSGGLLDILERGKLPFRLSVQTRYSANRPLERSGESWQWFDEQASFQARVYRNNRDNFGVSFSFLHRHLETKAVLPDTGERIRPDWYKIQLGVGYMRYTGDRQRLGIEFKLTSPSDKPFHSFDETYFELSVNYVWPYDMRNIWIFGLGMNTFRWFPFPFIAFIHIFENGNILMVGIPFLFLHLKFGEIVRVQLGYFPVANLNAEVAFRVHRRFEPYLAFKWENEEFLRQGRNDDDWQLKFERKTAQAGVKWFPHDQVMVQAMFGWAFDRRFYEQEGRDKQNELDIKNGAYGMLRASVKF